VVEAEVRAVMVVEVEVRAMKGWRAAVEVEAEVRTVWR
jgi:hypothetical protein